MTFIAEVSLKKNKIILEHMIFIPEITHGSCNIFYYDANEMITIRKSNIPYKHDIDMM